MRGFVRMVTQVKLNEEQLRALIADAANAKIDEIELGVEFYPEIQQADQVDAAEGEPVRLPVVAIIQTDLKGAQAIDRAIARGRKGPK